MVSARLLLAGLAITLSLASQALAQESKPLRGVALVIGNSAYENLPSLPNPANDARAVETVLDGLGFDTQISSDRDARRLTRDLERFAEDASDADVAILYYSGHGIEAGENYLVPVDADFSALDEASERLVPLSALIAKLQASVPVTIIMLDACRSNPFPPGSVVRATSDALPSPIGAAGLGAARGAVPVKQADGAPSNESVGTVIAFAAAPGEAALDGKAGANSPYTNAVLKHLSAMSGEEFGTVMRMVAEEVYLKTDGRQRPWVNESLRRLLYFGKAPSEPTGDEGDILKERRQLLLTIAMLPDANRKQVEATAAERGVPMDVLYGMLKTLGADTPRDAVEFDRLLRDQAERLKVIMAERSALKSTDPEILRLSKLADEATSEGALQTAIRLNEQAKARVKELAPTLEKAQADLKARFIDAADVYGRSAAACETALDFRKAADDYGEAFDQIERWDSALAWRNKQKQTAALTDYGNLKNDNAALTQAIATADEALKLAPRLTAPDDWASTQAQLGDILRILGDRQGDAALLEKAVSAYQAALEVRSREHAPLDWAETVTHLGIALGTLGQRDRSNLRLEQAVAAHRAALLGYPREREPFGWARAQNNLANALASLGERETDPRRLEEAGTAYRAALDVYTRSNAPISWAVTRTNLGTTLLDLARREHGTVRLEEAIAMFRSVLEEVTRDQAPLSWAYTNVDLGSGLVELGTRTYDPASVLEAIDAFHAADQEITQARLPIACARTQVNLGDAFSALGRMQQDTARLEEAVAAYRAALTERTRNRVPLDWASSQASLGGGLFDLGVRKNDRSLLEQSVTAFRAALEEYTPEQTPSPWALNQTSLGDALQWLGDHDGDTARLQEAVAANFSISISIAVYLVTIEHNMSKRQSQM